MLDHVQKIQIELNKLYSMRHTMKSQILHNILNKTTVTVKKEINKARKKKNTKSSSTKPVWIEQITLHALHLKSKAANSYTKDKDKLEVSKGKLTL